MTLRDARHIRWLFGELPDLVDRGILSASDADRLRGHYGSCSPAVSTVRRFTMFALGVLGATLMGGGVILLLAHNWENLSRLERAVVALFPLLFSSILGAWSLWTGRGGAVFRESTATFQTLAVGAALALVAQTYHIPGRLDEFLLTWSLLVLPLTYLTGAVFPALVYLIGVLFWVGNTADAALWYLPFLAAVLPFLRLTAHRDGFGVRTLLLSWLLAITSPFGIALSLAGTAWSLSLEPLVHAQIFAVMFLAGKSWEPESSSVLQHPFRIVGALGTLCLALLITFGLGPPRLPDAFSPAALLSLALTAILILIVLVLWLRSMRTREWTRILLGAAGPLAAFSWLLALLTNLNAEKALFNVYLFATGVGLIAEGFFLKRISTINIGMSILSALFLFRFFDLELSFTVRGALFIILGALFLGVNFFLLKDRRARSSS